MDELTTELHEYATLDSLYPLLTSSREGIMFQNEYRSNRTTENNKTLFSIVPYGKCTYRHMSDDDIFHSEDGTQIRLGTKKSKIAFLKLMNDAFLHSELTKQWYDASAKDNITQGAG